MKKFFTLFSLLCLAGSFTFAQDPNGPPPGGPSQIKQSPDILIPTGTKNTDLIYMVNGRDGRLYQAYLGTKLGNPEDLKKTRDTGHLAYATFGTDNLFEPAVRMTHNDGNPSLELKYISHNVEKPD